MPRYDDRDDDGPLRFPLGARAAGIIWVVFGAFGLIAQVVSIGMEIGPRNPAGTVCGILFAVAFVAAGILTLVGSAPSLLANGIGSIVLSLFYLGLGAVAVVGKTLLPGRLRDQHDGGSSFILIVGFVLMVFGAVLMTAGVLAALANRAYHDWQYERRPRPRRDRRRRYRDDDDSDARPRRRRSRDDDDDR